MSHLPEYAERNRSAWSKWSPDWVEAGRRSWESPEITWGMWDVRESDLGVFDDLAALKGKAVIEMGCGTAYWSAWFTRLGMHAVGIDVTPGQLETARTFQKEFGLDFELIEGNAEQVPKPDASFDLAFSEYGASIWCDPEKWIPEAHRLLRPGGRLIFLRNGTIQMLCMPASGPATTQLQRDYFGMKRLEWEDDESVEFHLPTGALFRLLKRSGFLVEDFIELRAPADAPETRFEFITKDWARRWPSEEIWVARKG